MCRYDTTGYMTPCAKVHDRAHDRQVRQPGNAVPVIAVLAVIFATVSLTMALSVLVVRRHEARTLDAEQK